MKEDIVYLYINSFAYKQAKHGNAMGGHPVPGRIYRALYDKETTNYRLLLDEVPPSGMAGLILKDLRGECGNWTADITKLDEDNLLTLEIESEDFEKLAKWKDAEAELDEIRLENVQDVERGDEGNISLHIEIPQSKNNDGHLRDILDDIKSKDPDVVSGLNTALFHINGYLHAREDGLSEISRKVISDQFVGTGASIALAVDAIDDYINERNPGYLARAVYYLLLESSRNNS